MLAPGVAESGLSSELDTLRQRKFELEQRMRLLQDTRRDLVGQLEHLMRVLKVNPHTTDRRLCSFRWHRASTAWRPVRNLRPPV
jgi:hypothetical protein